MPTVRLAEVQPHELCNTPGYLEWQSALENSAAQTLLIVLDPKVLLGNQIYDFINKP